MYVSLSSDPIRVEIDNELEPIVPEFIENRKKDCQLINSLLDSASFSEIRTLAHRMKGAGGSYGFDDVSELGESMEEAAMTGDGETIRRSLARLSDYLERVTVTYI